MGFDRSTVKKTSLETLQKKQSEFEAKRPSFNGANFGALDPGDNILRIYPAHPTDGDAQPFTQPKCVSFLTVKKQKRDENGKPVEGEMEVKRSPIFNSKVHGGYDMDIVETYMEVAKKIAIPNFTDNKELASKIWNYMTYAGKGSQAIKPSDVWVVYASKLKGGAWEAPALFDLKKTVAAQLTERAAEYAGDMQTPDIYSDPDDGLAVVVSKTGKDKDTEYKVRLHAERDPDNRNLFQNVPVPLTDDQLEIWSKMPSLEKLYVNSFKRKDLEYQIDGLQRFDEYLEAQGFPINVFQYDEFINVVNEMLDLVPEDNEKEQQEQVEEKPTTKVIKKPVTTVASKPISKPIVKKVVEPEPEEEVEEELADEEIEEVVEEIKPKLVARKPITPVNKPAEQKAAPHIAKTNDRLAELKAKMGKK